MTAIDYSQITPRVVTPPTELPVTLAEAKGYARGSLPVDDVVQDQVLADALAEAVEFAEQIVQWRAIMPQTLALDFEAWPEFPLRLPRPIARSLTAWTYRDRAGATQTFATSNFVLNGGRLPPEVLLKPNVTLPELDPNHPLPLALTWEAGYASAAAVPQVTKQGIKAFARWRWDHRDGTEVPAGVMQMLRLDAAVFAMPMPAGSGR